MAQTDLLQLNPSQHLNISLADVNPQIAIVPVKQPCGSAWCWAACASMILQTYSISTTPCKVVNAYIAQFPGAPPMAGDCCVNPSVGCLQQDLPASDVVGLYQLLGNMKCVEIMSPGSNCTEQENALNLSSYFKTATKPYLVWYNRISPFEKHMILIIGCYSDGPNSFQLQMSDPEVAEDIVEQSLHDFMVNGDWRHTWQFS